MQIADPYAGMISFQQALLAGNLDISLVHNHQDLYSHIDQPSPDTIRLTYVRLAEDCQSVIAFVACIMNGQIGGFPCVAVGYAVSAEKRNRGFAKQILKDVVRDQVIQAGQMGHRQLFIEAVIDVDNIESQRVAEAVLQSQRESITDAASGRPAFRYTSRFDTSSGLPL